MNLNIDFSTILISLKMMKWPKGIKKKQRFWNIEMKFYKHWYHDKINSTEFTPFQLKILL